jgi:hypothetical protein
LLRRRQYEWSRRCELKKLVSVWSVSSEKKLLAKLGGRKGPNIWLPLWLDANAWKKRGEERRVVIVRWIVSGG